MKPIFNKEELQKINDFLDEVIEFMRLKNDAALCRQIDIMPPVISKLRHGVLPFGPIYIIKIHELTDWSIADIKAALPAPKVRIKIGDIKP